MADRGKVTNDDFMETVRADNVNEYTRTMDMVTDTVVVHTTVEASTDEEYSIFFTDADDTTGELSIANDAMERIQQFMSPALPGPGRFVVFTDDDMDDGVNERMFDGTFYGVPGTFACTGNAECRTEMSADGMLSLTGMWSFTPDGVLAEIMVEGVIPDTDYMDFGYWLTETKDGDGGVTYMVRVFAGGPVDYNYPDNDVSNVVGSAVYSGSATGLYVLKGFDEQNRLIPTATGEFMADAKLTATFGGSSVPEDDHFSMKGSIYDFMDSSGNHINPFWKVSLNDDDFENGMLGGDNWQGNFHGPSTVVDGITTAPTDVSGTFEGTFDDGNAIGAFGATR